MSSRWQAWQYHLSSLLWHSAASVTVVYASRGLGLTQRAAYFAGLLFAVHPLTSIVANAIAFRSEAMLVFFLMGLLVAHCHQNPAASAVCLFFAATTKETALVFAPLMLGTLAYTFKNDGRIPLKVWISEALAWVAAVAVRLAFAPSWRAQAPSLSLGSAIATRLASLNKSMLVAFTALDRTVCDAFPVTDFSSYRPWLGLACMCALAVLAYKRRGPAILLGLAMLPSLQIVPVMRWWSPHYLYLPLGFAAMLVAEQCSQRNRMARYSLLGLCLVLAVVSFCDGFRFRTDRGLWTYETEREPRCREGQFYLGEVARAERQYDNAAQYYGKALHHEAEYLSYVDLVAASQNLGIVRLEQKRFADAFAAFAFALRHAGRDSERTRELRHNAALAAFSAGNAKQAAEVLSAECDTRDTPNATLLLCAKVYYALGDKDASLRYWQQVQLNTRARAGHF